MGPIAPKDPVKKKPAIYLMYDKEIFAQPFKDGKGMCFLYMDGGRMPALAQMVGGIDDENMLAMLVKTADFKKLVYGLGISMINDAGVDGDFFLQMYGKTDPYVTGTTITTRITSDGTEYLIPFSEVKWSDDDDIIGQIRFAFDKPGFKASVMVKLYLNDGYTAPEFVPADPVDLASDAYKKLIKQSLVSLGNTERITRAINKAKNGESVKVAFIGGSITQGAGATPINAECYAFKTYTAFDEMFSSAHNTEYIKAGVGGTPSELGIIRFNKDILRPGYFHFNKAETVPDREPDLMIVEFAVNDEGDETKGMCFEGLIRRCLMMKNQPGIIIIFSVFIDDYNLQDRLSPIGYHYNIPMVSAKNAVTEQFYLSKDQGRIITKDQYFYDRYHPTNLGHTVMADTIINLLKVIGGLDKNAPENAAYTMPSEPKMSDAFEYISTFGIGPDDEKSASGEDGFGNPWSVCNIDAGDFTECDKELHGSEMDYDLHATFQNPVNRMHIKGDKGFSLDVDCKLLMIIIKDSASADVGSCEFYVDDQLVRSYNPREIGWTHCNPLIVFNNENKGKHHVVIKMKDGDEDKKLTILGFGIR